MRDYRSAYGIKRHLNTLSGVYSDGIDDKLIQEFAQAPTAWTFSVMSNHVDNANTIQLFNYCKSDGTNIRLQVNILATNQVFVRVMTTGTPATHTFAYVLEEGVWNHIAVTCSGTEWVLYVDGFEKERATLSTAMDLDFVALDDDRIKMWCNNAETEFSEGLMAHNTLFDKVLTQSEIYFITENLGVIPNGCEVNMLHYQPLQYNSFKQHQVFNDNTAVVGVAVNQVAHLFVLNNVVVLDGTYRLATLADAIAGVLELRTVVAVAGVDDFTYGVTGTWVAGFTHDVGTLLYLQDDGTLSPIQTDYLLAVVIAGGDGQIGSTTELVAVSSVTQCNVDKALVDAITEEYKAIVSGKTWDELNFLDKNGYPYPADYVSKDFYDKADNLTVYRAGRSYNGINQFDTVNNWVEVDKGQAWTVNIQTLIDSLVSNQTFLTQGLVNDSSPPYDNNKGLAISFTSAGLISVNLSNGNANRLIVRFSTVGVGYNSIFVTYDGSGSALGVTARSAGVDLPRVIIEDTLVGSILQSTLKTVVIGALPDMGAFRNYVDGLIFKIQWMDTDYSGTQALLDAEAIGSFEGIVADARFLLDINVDHPSNRFIAPTNRLGTPQYVITEAPLNQAEFTGKLETRSNLPVIQQGLRLRNINAGGATDQFLLGDSTDLPNGADDFTLTWSGVFNDSPVGAVFLGFTFEMPFCFVDSFTSRDYLRVEWIIEGGTAYKIRVIEYDNNVSTGNILSDADFTKKANNNIISIAVVRRDGVVYLLINGVQMDGSFTSVVDYSVSYQYMIGYDPSYARPVSTEFYTDFTVISNSYDKRALSNAEIIQEHNNAMIANPLLYNTYKVDGMGQNSQADTIVHNLYNQDLARDDGGTLKVSNLMDGTGSTDTIVEGYASLVEINENQKDIRQLRLATEVL